MPPVSTRRLLALRALYALMAFGLGFVIWPQLLQPDSPVPDPPTVVRALLGALGLMAAVGLRAPLPMLPVLLFELLWKLVWVGVVALPAWRHDQLGTYGMATLIECLPVFVLFPLVIPWPYVCARYLRKPGAP